MSVKFLTIKQYPKLTTMGVELPSVETQNQEYQSFYGKSEPFKSPNSDQHQISPHHISAL